MQLNVNHFLLRPDSHVRLVTAFPAQAAFHIFLFLFFLLLEILFSFRFPLMKLLRLMKLDRVTQWSARPSRPYFTAIGPEPVSRASMRV